MGIEAATLTLPIACRDPANHSLNYQAERRGEGTDHSHKLQSCALRVSVEQEKTSYRHDEPT